MYYFIFIATQLTSSLVLVAGVQHSSSLVDSLLLIPPLVAVTEYWTWFPAPHGGFLLVICFVYSSVCVLIPASQFTPPSPPLSTWVTITLPFVFLSFFLSFFFFFKGCTRGMWKFPGEGSNRSCSCRPTPQPQPRGCLQPAPMLMATPDP